MEDEKQTYEEPTLEQRDELTEVTGAAPGITV